MCCHTGAYLNSDKTLLSESLEAGASVKGTFSLDARQYTASCYTCHTLRHCDHRSYSVINIECNSVLTEVVTAARSEWDIAFYPTSPYGDTEFLSKHSSGPFSIAIFGIAWTPQSVVSLYILKSKAGVHVARTYFINREEVFGNKVRTMFTISQNTNF